MDPRAALGRTLPFLLVFAFLFSAAPTASANPNVPYCEGSVAGTYEQRVIQPDVCEAATGRVFPEALMAKDFVSFYEFEAGIQYLDQQYPDLIEVIQVAESVGLPDPSGAMRSFPIYIVELTNEQSPVPAEEKQQLFFMLSIHGNEKGGREGGFRVIEDLAKGIGIAEETVQNGAGMPEPLTKPDGGTVETYGDYLDFMRFIFIFPNADGWAHDEAEFASEPCPGYLPTLFCRTNGNGFDLNRQAPTLGYQVVNEGGNRLPVSQPEMIGSYQYMVENYQNVDYAIDIHGMLGHENFVAIMMPAGGFTPQEMLRSTRLAEDLKQRLNNDEHFAAWTDVLGSSLEAFNEAGGIPRETACQMVDLCMLPEPSDATIPLVGSSEDIASSEFSDWSTVWDAIGYTDSGFHGDFFAQQTGLNAPGYDIELAYNHITFDSQYEGIGAQMNDYHVQSVRHIVKSFADAAALDVQVSIETGGLRTLYVKPTYVATNVDDEEPTPGGWADENLEDDLWQYTADMPFTATPAKFWEDLKPFLRDGDAPGVLVGTTADKLSGAQMATFDNMVIPGSAIQELEENPGAVEAVLAWVEAGGNLVLTDEALRFLDLSGLTSGAVDMREQYAGAIELDRSHEMVADVRGEARQTYEPVPLGFEVGTHSPNWFVDRAAFEGIAGDAAGTTVGQGSSDQISLGRVDVAEGRIQFIGALLPDPTEEYYHPYGLDHYATTYSGNQILRNMLGWTEVFATPPVIIADDGQIVQSDNERSDGTADDGEAPDEDEKTPAVGLVTLAILLAGIALRRRRA